MKILGLDMSLNSTGVVLLDGPDKVEMVTTINPLTTKPGKRKGKTIKVIMKGFERQLYILEEIRRIFDLYEVDAVAIENYSYGSHGNAIIQLAELGGILRFYLYEKKIPFQVFSPQTVKSFLLGKGNKKMPRKESKELMLKTAQRMAFLKFKNDDEADAYTLARLKISIELNKQGLPFSLNEHQAKIVEKWSKV